MPYRIGVRFRTKDLLRWTGALFRVKAVAYGQVVSVPRRCALRYTWLIRGNMKSFWSSRPLTTHYYDWKMKMAAMGLAQKGFWRLHDHLMNSLMVFPVQKEKNQQAAYMGGVPDGIFAMRISMFGGTQKPKEVAMYGKKAEELRPLFGPTAEQFIAHGYWDYEVAQTMKKIKGAWR